MVSQTTGTIVAWGWRWSKNTPVDLYRKQA
jgi:hypothetical protein